MNTVFVALAVFFVITTSQRFVSLPRWMWPPLTLILALGGVFIADLPWWQAFSAAGISTIVNGLEALLLAVTDRAILDLPRPRTVANRR